MPLNWQTQSLVVTGADGWLGYRLVDTLVRGLTSDERFATPADVELRALILPGQDAKRLSSLGTKVQVIEGDLRDPATSQRLLEGTEGALLFHTAGIIHPGRAREFREVNVEGTRNLLTAALARRARRAVVVSSNSPIGCNPAPDHTFDESSPFNPYMGYGRSKMEMEQYVGEVQAGGRLETVIVRPPWFYGPYQPPRQTLFFEMVRDGKAPIVGGGNNRRSMVYIDNLCQGLMLAATVPQANGQVYWIADAEPYTMNQVIDTIERVMEELGFTMKHKRMRLPGLASSVAQLVDASLQAVGLYHQRIHVLSEMNKTIACSVEKAKRELAYDPHVALEEGMRSSIRWCIAEGLLEPDRPAAAAGAGTAATAGEAS